MSMSVYCCSLFFAACIVAASGSTAAPTFSPTKIPTEIVELSESASPIALHQLVVVDSAGSSVIRLKSFDIDSYNVSYILKFINCHTDLTILVISFIDQIFGELDPTVRFNIPTFSGI